MSTVEAKIRQRSHVTENGCWEWTGATFASGYARISDARAHRASYETFVGSIPDGLTIDHLCRNKLCVNPDHLEAVTTQENTRRHYETVTHCKYGHPFDEENTAVWGKKGQRSCRTCHRDYWARNAEAINARRKARAVPQSDPGDECDCGDCCGCGGCE